MMLSKRRRGVALCAAVAAAIAGAQGVVSSVVGAQDQQLGETTVALAPSADTYVVRWNPLGNAGRQTVLTVDGQAVPDSSRALIGFNQDQIEAALAEKGLVRATLRLNITLPAISWLQPEVTLHRMKKSWTERGATWLNVFGLLGLNDAYEAEPTAKLIITSGQTGVIEFDVTDDIVSFMDNSALNYGWMLKEDQIAAGVWAHIGSRESSAAPQLQLVIADGDVADEVSIDTSEPGVLVVDASDTEAHFPVPDYGMTFATEQEVFDWAVDNLNAELVIDDSGAVLGVAGSVLTIGTPYTIHPITGDLEPVVDEVAALLGGRRGILTIGGTEYCLREDGCLDDLTLKAAPPRTMQGCDGAEFCIRSESFTHAFPPIIKIYQSIGSSVRQTRGGHQRRLARCQARPILPRNPIFQRLLANRPNNPFSLALGWRICVKGSGENVLSLSQTYRTENEFTPGQFGVLSLPAVVRRNTGKVERKHWSAGFLVNSKPYVKGMSDLGGLVGICSAESSESNALWTATETSAGNVREVCDDETYQP